MPQNSSVSLPQNGRKEWIFGMTDVRNTAIWGLLHKSGRMVGSRNPGGFG
jgi:hypothetical protein